MTYMSIQGVYYEHYLEHSQGAYRDEEKSIPYMVLIKDKDLREKFKQELLDLGFSCVTWNSTYPGVLVNMELRRFALIYKPAVHTCVDGRNYTYDEFCEEILNSEEHERERK